jgi:hypothetical protein
LPKLVFWSRYITDGVSCGLHHVYKEIQSDSFIIGRVEGGTDKSIEGRDEEDEDHEEGEETGNILDAGSEKGNHVADTFVHSQDGENLHRGGSKENQVYKEQWSVNMRADIIVFTDLDIPVWVDTFTGM